MWTWTFSYESPAWVNGHTLVGIWRALNNPCCGWAAGDLCFGHIEIAHMGRQNWVKINTKEIWINVSCYSFSIVKYVQGKVSIANWCDVWKQCWISVDDQSLMSKLKCLLRCYWVYDEMEKTRLRTIPQFVLVQINAILVSECNHRSDCNCLDQSSIYSSSYCCCNWILADWFYMIQKYYPIFLSIARVVVYVEIMSCLLFIYPFLQSCALTWLTWRLL